MDDRTPTEGDTPADLARRVAELEITVARLTAALETRSAPHDSALADLLAGLGQREPVGAADPVAKGATAAPTPRSDTRSLDDAETDPNCDDAEATSRMLTRAGAVAAGAVLGGAAATVATASPAAAATGSFDTSNSTPAVTATSTGTGAAVQATNSAGGTAVVAESTGADVAVDILSTETQENGTALRVEARGETSGGLRVEGGKYGVWASAFEASDSVGVVAAGEDGLVSFARGYGAVLVADRAALLLDNQIGTSGAIPAPPSTTFTRSGGEVVFDGDYTLWLCVADGTPGTWRRLAGPSTAGALTVLPSPVRVYDSRPGQPPFVAPQTRLAAGTPRTGLALTTASSGIPTDATAAIVTTTVANTGGGSPTIPGFLTLYANGVPTPNASTLNWTTAGAVVATTTTVALGPNATIAALANYTTDLIIDAIAYYR